MEYETGKKYRLTATLRYDGEYPEYHKFRDSEGDNFLVPKGDVVSIDEVPWEVRDGDVYLRNGNVYQVMDTSITGGTFVTGSTATVVTADMNFRESELIHRENR